MHDHRLHRDHRPLTVVRSAAPFVNEPDVRARAACGVDDGKPKPAGDPSIEWLFERAAVTVRRLIAPEAEVPVVDPQLTVAVARELRTHVADPEIEMRDPEEAHVVQRHAASHEELPGGGLVVAVLDGEIDLDVVLHRRDQVAHDFGGREAGLVLRGRPQHPHRLMALVLTRENPPVPVVRGGRGDSGPGRLLLGANRFGLR